MASPSARAGPAANNDDDTVSVSAITDIELDSKGAGSPPPSSFGQVLHPDIGGGGEHVEAAHSAGGVGPISAAGSGVATRQPPASPTLEAALGETLVISGGSGYNDLVGATPGATYVMPISDNGGSSSEIIRVLGGPSIGDLRSRLNRLIPTPSQHDPFASSSSSEPPQSNEAIHNLLSYRLPSSGKSREIKQEWMDILEGRHRLWRGIESERKEVIRGFLVHFESEVLRRAHRHFNFRGGSIGNFFLAAAQKFFRSIQSAIFLFSATTQISTSSPASKVLPVINTNHTATIAAELEDGEIIVGQCEISHPAPKPRRSSVALKISLAPAAMERGGSLASQPPGTPSSAVWDQQVGSGREGMLPAEALQGLGLGDGGPLTPGFGPPAHYHVNELFASASSNYTSMNASVDALKTGASDSESHSGPSSKLGARSAAGPSPLFAQLVDDRAAAYSAQARKGLTTVGNQKDGLDPEDDDQDSQDGIDAADSPRDSNAAEKDPSPDSNLPSLIAMSRKAFSQHSNSSSTKTRSSWKEKTGNIIFSKAEDEDYEPALPSPIRRIFYVNAYRNEIYPAPNPSFVTALSRSKTIIYSCGSLWTSIVPCLCLRSIATSIATSSTLRYKVLLLNSVQDRETRGMDAVDFVQAIRGSLNHSDQPTPVGGKGEEWKLNQLISHVVYFPDGQVKVDVEKLEALGIRCIAAKSQSRSKSGAPKFDEESVRTALRRITTQA
ncbi:hypothetical protein NDA11_005898 [Ustilago hordei]|nr:hypothetical protein NDA15_007396 [Ustilago hordei]KAJ1588454.1 hypothetical protein NDA12_007602 [Ustilago hordei]KAJ1593201.1 hypothetical protein NDA11_005898 [Ustilago hordei]KAJ1601406.1 hypothetical protein NDA14_002194 [Ustilago hordei]UTT93904.1 hypothetical protein NDA17_004153 [Ustilago hordei]